MKTVLVTGANGQLGQCIQKIQQQHTGINFHFKSSSELNITNTNAVNDYFSNHAIDYCVNCAAYTNVELAESEEFQKALESIKGWFGEAQVKLEKFVAAFSKDPGKALSDLVGKAMSGLGSIIGDAIWGIFTSPKVIAAMVVGVGAMFAVSKVKDMIFGGGKNSAGTSMSSPMGGGSGGGKGGGNAGAGLGKGISNVGKGIGKGLGGILKGLASGIAAFANPAVLLGGVNLGLVIL